MTAGRINWVGKGSDVRACDASPFGADTAHKVAVWHASFPEYAPTPLVNLDALAADLGVAGIHVKDESFRFGLNSRCWAVAMFWGVISPKCWAKTWRIFPLT